jgi:hypothetical protein
MSPPLEAGTFYARVRAFGGDGFESLPSAVKSVRVVGLELPAQASVAHDGVIMMPRGSALTLQNAEGLLLGVRTARTVPELPRDAALMHFAAAPAELRFSNPGARRIVLRDGATGQEQAFVVAMRELAAEVVTSAREVRSGEPVQVRVRTHDPSGRVDASREVVDVRVELAGQTLTVPWARAHDGTLVGTVMPQVPAGPWLLQVIVRDASGRELAHRSVEVHGAELRSVGHRVADSTEVRMFR